MKKLVMLLLLSTFLITGCSITTLSNSDIDNNINKLLMLGMTIMSYLKMNMVIHILCILIL